MRAGLISIVREMSVTLTRTAYSTIIRDVHDFSCVVFDARGRLIAQAEGIPSFNGGMRFALDATTSKFPLDEMQPGDVFLSNDPYFGEGASFHKNDINIIMPIFLDGELVMLSASKAHYLDIGGKDPGSYSPDAENTYQEGLTIPPVKLYDQGVLNEAVLDIFLANVRVPAPRARRPVRAAGGRQDGRAARDRAGRQVRPPTLDARGRRPARPRRADGPRGGRRRSPTAPTDAEGFHDGDGRPRSRSRCRWR